MAERADQQVSAVDTAGGGPVAGSAGVPAVGPQASSAGSPRRRQVNQSCGRHTAAVPAAAAGSCSASQRNFVTVNDATGTMPTACAHAAPPPNSLIRSRAAPADRVSCHSNAGRTTRPVSSRHTIPCCCAPTATAATSRSPPAPSSAAAVPSTTPRGVPRYPPDACAPMPDQLAGLRVPDHDLA